MAVISNIKTAPALQKGWHGCFSEDQGTGPDHNRQTVACLSYNCLYGSGDARIERVFEAVNSPQRLLSRTDKEIKVILRYTILYVPDVAAALDFYNRAFGMETEFLHASGDYGQLSTGETRLAFSSTELMTSLGKTPGQANPTAPVFEIAFETDDVEVALKKAKEAGAKVVQDIKQEEWGQTTSYVTDPNGYLIEICSPVGEMSGSV